MGDGNYLGPIGDAAIADVERRSSHCYREILEHRETKTTIAADGSVVTSAGEIVRTEVFICGSLGPPCYVCGAVSAVLCDFPIGDEARTCDRALCDGCAPTVGHDKNFCPEHIEAGAGPNMLLFKRPPPTREQLAELARETFKKQRKKPLPKAPPPDRRWRVCRQETNGSTCQITRWMTQWGAHSYVKELANPATYYVETWDQFVTWHRRTYPLAPRKKK
jgi:hypothetical protein